MIILDDSLSQPLYWQIYQHIREEIHLGQMPEGSKLPSTRRLAKALNVGRNTVERAYLQLWSEGYVANNNRSKFIVQKADNQQFSELAGQTTNKASKIIKPIANPTCKCNFQYGNLAANDFPLHWWRKISNQCLIAANLENMMQYNNHQGESDLQIEIMTYLNKSRNVSCQPNQIVICSGIHSCLSLLSQLFRHYSTNLAIEDPGFDGSRNVFMNNGYRIIPIGLKDNGINLEELEKSAAKIIFVTPSHQFPTGTIMPIQKRLELLNWAVRKNGLIIEDDYDSELRYNTKPIPSMQGIDLNDRVVYIGTFSKVLSPALRLSYMVLPQSWLERYRIVFKNYYSSVPWLQQEILQQFMKLGYWDSLLRKVCLANKKKHDFLVHNINKLMADKVIIHGKNAGLHIMLEVNNGLSEDALIEKAKRHGIIVYPVSRYWMRQEKYSKNMVLLGFGGMKESNIAEGINLLNQAWFSAPRTVS